MCRIIIPMIPPGRTANSPVSAILAVSVIVGSASNSKSSIGLYALKCYGIIWFVYVYTREIKNLPALGKNSFSSKLTRTLNGALDAEIIGSSISKQWLKLQ